MLILSIYKGEKRKRVKKQEERKFGVLSMQTFAEETLFISGKNRK